MKDFDDTIHKYYSGKSLPPESVSAILSKSSKVRKSFFRGYYKLAAVAAALLIVFIGLHQQLNKAAVAQGVLAEVAMNHLKGLNVEVASDQYPVVREKLNRLDFPILPRRKELIESYTLLGGRYCSIHGGLAAQLKLREKSTGKVLTLYVTKLTKKLEGLTPLDAERDGVPIRLWQENGRFFALAGD